MSWGMWLGLAGSIALVVGLLVVAIVTVVIAIRKKPVKTWQVVCTVIAGLIWVPVLLRLASENWHGPLVPVLGAIIVVLVGMGVYALFNAGQRSTPQRLPSGVAEVRLSQMTGATPHQPPTPPLTEKFCFQCGAKIHGLAEICPKCGLRQPMLPGMPVAGAASTMTGRNRVAAALFAILLGGLGIHKFYLGRVGWGIIYLLFCWTFIPAVVGLIEGIVYLSMSDVAFAEKYGS